MTEAVYIHAESPGLKAKDEWENSNIPRKRFDQTLKTGANSNRLALTDEVVDGKLNIRGKNIKIIVGLEKQR